ncbi:putative hydrolase [Propionibacterium cyclohexanicum]|uniref:Putative hydrolase n=1 Tax=Propionibacterium cyclohexanicum TaxID=64702 RepID=A0A1H9QY06_9ACTN|nr:zinc-dependent metalloprotease [Propionibacterium cyclohexanicum]SER65338.1 putative hydrolase [Propionibacterium cyclohexanicum]
MSDEKMGPPGEPERDPLSELLRQLGFTVPPQGLDLSTLMSQFQQAMQRAGANADAESGIDWAATRQAARRVVAALGPDPTPGQTQRRELADADRLAESWLDPTTSFPALSRPAQAWSRAEWVEDTMDSWRTIVDPIVRSIADAMAASFGGEAASEVPELGQLSGLFGPLLRSAAGQMYAVQLAQAIGQIAAEVVSGAELGLQLLSAPRVVLLPTNADAFVKGLGLADEDALMYLTVREAARQRLFASVSWLGPQLLALIEHYAREITIDSSALTDAVDMDSLGELTPEKLQEVSRQLQGRLFKPTRTPEQEDVLVRLETLMALIEGWVDAVTHDAASPWLSQEPALMEAIRRRRATGGPAEKVTSALVGLELHPRRVREAQRLWQAVEADRGIEGRDAVWSHPDLIPTASDLDDPIGFVQGDRDEHEGEDWDAGLAELLQEHDDNQGPGEGPSTGSEGQDPGSKS